MTMLSVLALTFLPAPSIQESPDTARAASEMLGTWTYSGGRKTGVELGAEHFEGRQVVITDEAIELHNDGAQVENRLFVLEYEMRGGSPLRLDLRVTKSPFGVGQRSGALIRVEDDRLTFAYRPFGGGIPDDFEAARGSGTHVFHLQRRELDAEDVSGSWRPVRGSRNGEPLDGARLERQRVEVEDGSLVLDGGDGMVFTMSMDLDVSGVIPTVDLLVTSSPFGTGARARGLVQRMGDRLALRYAMGTEVPESFVTNEAEAHSIFLVLERP